MAKTVIKLDPKFVDGFAVLRKTSSRNCAFQKCRRRAKVAIYWRAKYTDLQSRDDVCSEHAIDLANSVIGVRKFGHKL